MDNLTSPQPSAELPEHDVDEFVVGDESCAPEGACLAFCLPQPESDPMR
jgi:hypothetical protein